jgi:hypothetical protein
MIALWKCTGLAFAAVLVAAQPASAQSAKLFFEGDMVRGQTQDGATGATCVLTSQFKRREEVVWRIRVRDGKTGDQVTDKGVKSVVVEMSDGQKIPAHYGAHPRGKPTDNFWGTAWSIPANYPTGSLTYKVVVTDNDGQTTSWEPFNVALSALMVIPGDVTFTK